MEPVRPSQGYIKHDKEVQEILDIFYHPCAEKRQLYCRRVDDSGPGFVSAREIRGRDSKCPIYDVLKKFPLPHLPG